MQLLGEYLAIGPAGYVCRRCGHQFCSVQENWKMYARFRQAPVSESAIGAPIRVRPQNDLVFRQYYCPGCNTQIDTEVNLAQSPPRWNFRPLGVSAQSDTSAPRGDCP
jgi:acetone carboxylase gamma subunit